MRQPLADEDSCIVSPAAEIAIQHAGNQRWMRRVQFRVAVERPAGAETI
jgi:hypothetical protein